MTYAEYKKQRLSENTTKSNTSSTTNGSYAEYKKQRLSGNLNQTTKIENPYTPTININAVAKASKTSTPVLMNAINATATTANPSLTEAGTTGNWLTKTSLKLNDFAKDNNLSVSGHDMQEQIASLQEQSKNLDKSKQQKLQNYINMYNQAYVKDMQDKNYYLENAKTGFVRGLAGGIDAIIASGNNLTNASNRVARNATKNNLYALEKLNKTREKLGKEPISTSTNEKLINKYNAMDEKATKKANKLLEYNILGEYADSLGKDIAIMAEVQNVGKIKKIAGDVISGVTGMAPTTMLSLATGNPALGLAVMSSGAGGSAYREAIKEGYTQEQAFNYGTLEALKEYATEKMLGVSNKLAGFDVKGYGDEFLDSLVNRIFKENSNSILKETALYLAGATGEGLEEFVSELVDPYIKNLTLGTKESASFKDALYSGLVGALTGAVMSLPGEVNNINQRAQNQGINNNVQNASNNVQNQANIEQNLQNVSNLENNQQMSISDVENTNATLPSHIQTFVENRNQVSPGLNVQMDNTLNTDGVIIKNQDGTRTIKVNPNSNNAYEFVTMHEMLHDLSGTQEYQELANFVKERAMTHDSFEEAKQTITDKYTKYYQENGLDMSNLNMDVETVNDMTAQALGNQQFLNELAGKKPNVFMRIYNWVKNVLFDGQKTGKTFSERRADNKYLNELKKKFETAYNTAYKSNGETKYSIQTDNNGNKYVKVDTDQNIFDGKTLKEQKEIAKKISDRLYEIRKKQDDIVIGYRYLLSDYRIDKYTDNEYVDNIVDYNFSNKAEQEKAKKTLKEYIELDKEYAKLDKQYENERYTDAYEQFRTEIYKLAGKDADFANTGGTGMYLENKDELIKKYREKLANSGYDGIIIKDTTYDNGIFETGKEKNTQYVAFYPEQIKNVDNTSPTTNSDIRYSQSDKSWSKYLKEYWDLMPNSTKTFGLPTAEELQNFDNEQSKKAYKSLHKLEDIADMTEDDIRNEKGVNYKHKKDKGTKNERKFFENAKTSEIINNDIKESIDITTYERQSNAETLEKAKNKLDEQGDKLIKQWESKTKNFTAEDVAIGAILIERYQQLGDNESAVNVVQKLADMGTEVGRAVQMYSIFQRLTPEAMMIYQQRKLNDVFKEISQRKTGEWVEQNKDKFKLTSEDSKFITEQVEKVQQATSEREKQIELAKIEKRINDKLPPERGQTIKAIRRIAMLFNPKTQVRNVVGNALIMPVNDVADIIGTQIDKLIAKKTGVRTTNYANLKEKGKGIKKGLSEAVQDYKMGIRTEPSGSKYEFNFGGKSFNENTKSKAVNFVNNKLNGIENLLGAVMSGGDRPFYEAAFNNSLQGQMKANNVTTPTTEMIDIAVNEALSRTWNDSNAYTEAVLAVRKAMNKLNIGGFGFGDLIIPFAKTPANLTKAIVEYSPIGLVEAIIDYSDMKKAISRGEMTAIQQKKFVNSISKAVAGSILYLIAGTLAHTGAITGSADDDKDVKNFEQNVLGIQPYSIKIGDKTFTYSWANPLNAPLAIMADTYKMSKNNENWFDILTNAFKTAGEVVVDNSFLQGIKKLFEADSISEGLVDAVLDMPSQFIPTFLSQFATLFDKNKRQTFEYGDKLKTTVNQMKTKIPGLKNTLAPTVNTFGEEVENYGGDNNIFNVFLNPANVSEANATDTQKELYALYEATKDKTIFPRQAPYYLKDDGEKINLSSEERTEYQKTSGQYVTENLGVLLDSEFYKSLDNEDKVELINEVISDADTVAKDKWIDTKTTEKVSSRNKELDEVGIPLIDYYNAWFAKKEAEGKKNNKGETISGTKKRAQITAINEAVSDDLTISQKKELYKILNVD